MDDQKKIAFMEATFALGWTSRLQLILPEAVPSVPLEQYLQRLPKHLLNSPQKQNYPDQSPPQGEEAVQVPQQQQRKHQQHVHQDHHHRVYEKRRNMDHPNGHNNPWPLNSPRNNGPSHHQHQQKNAGNYTNVPKNAGNNYSNVPKNYSNVPPMPPFKDMNTMVPQQLSRMANGNNNNNGGGNAFMAGNGGGHGHNQQNHHQQHHLQHQQDQRQIMEDKYKTALCKSYVERGDCKYGNSCLFAHGHGELRRAPKYNKRPASASAEDNNNYNEQQQRGGQQPGHGHQQVYKQQPNRTLHVGGGGMPRQ